MSETSRAEAGPAIYVDGDACPVKEEVFKVAERHGLTVYVVSNQGFRPRGGLIKQILVAQEPDAADDWIAEHIAEGDIAITADIPLAARCIEKQSLVLGPTGKPFTEQSIGMALAMRDLKNQLREEGQIKGYNASFSKNDRSRFLQELDRLIQKAKRS